MSDSTAERSAGASSSPTWNPYVALVLVGLVPILALGVFAYDVATASVERLIHTNNASVATLTRELVEREFEHRVNVLDGFARAPGFLVAVRARDEEAVRRRLGILVESHPRVVRAFVTEPDGLLWSDYPKAPESLGVSFSHRDWYRGLSRDWTTYVSRVYRRHADPQPLLVAIAAPVRDPTTREVLGAVVYQVRLEGLTRLLRTVEVGRRGYVFLTDHTGTVAAHPRLDLQAREYPDYAGSVPVAAALAGRVANADYTDPITDERMLVTAIPGSVGGHRWVVVAQQPADEAYGPTRLLAVQILGAGLLLALLVGGLGFGLARSHGRVRSLNERLERLNDDLERENRERERAERALQASHEELERRVEARTKELREKEEQLRHAQKMEAMGRLAGGVAHDFNNLLTVIVGFCDILLQDLSEDGDLRSEVEEIRSAGMQASALTRQLLAFSRRQVLKPDVLDLNEVVGRMDRMLKRLIGEDIDLETHLRPDLYRVKFDPGQLEQILMNLAVNARDAMPEGGKLTIETANVELDEDYAAQHAGARPGPHVMLAVTDTGAGMDAETREQIFEPFFTTKGSKGTGLGLSTVYGIVKQSGGNIWVYSEPGRGTTFKVYLPRTEDTEAPAPTRAPKPARRAAAGTILVAEDDPGVRKLIGSVLGNAGYTVLIAEDAEAALELGERHDGPIDLVLTDVVLPHMDGRRLAESLVGLRPELGVLYMSGYTDDAIIHHGVLEPGTPFLEKPITPKRLLEKVREVLHGPAA